MRATAGAWILGAMVGCAAIAACGDDDDGARPTVDGGGLPTVDSATPDTSTGPDPKDGGTADAADGSAPEAKPIVLPLSANGHDRIFGIAVDAAGNVFAAGTRSATADATDDFESILVKIGPDGTLDTTFGTGGIASKNVFTGSSGEMVRGVVVQSTGKIVIAGQVDKVAADARDRDVMLLRFGANGAIDTSFGPDGTGVLIVNLSDPDAVAPGSAVFDAAWNLELGLNDTLFVGASFRPIGANNSDYAVLKVTANGAVDTSYGPDGTGYTRLDIDGRNASARRIVVLPDGSVVAAGYMTGADTFTRPVVYKLDPTGALVTTFGTGGVFNDLVLPFQAETYAAVPQGTKLVTTGYGKNASADTLDWLSLRLGADGQLDPTWGTNGIARIDVAGKNDQSRDLLVLPDSRVMLVGSGRKADDTQDAMIAILTADGKPDLGFAPNGYRMWDLGGPGDLFWQAKLSPDSKKVIVGGIATGPVGTDDDAVIFILPLTK